MIDLPATYFDRRTSSARAVQLRWHAFDGMLEIKGEGVAARYPRRDVTIEPRLGHNPRVIRLADGTRCEVTDDPAIDQVIATWATSRGPSRFFGLKTAWALLITGAVVLVVAAWAAIHFGLPWGARKIAFMLPADVMRGVGEQTLASLDRGLLQPTRLTHERQLQLQAEFQRFLEKTGDATPYRIEFRAMKEGGANAFALPSGVIIVTDALVQLAGDDRELVGVLAHECGHILHRHALRGVLQNSAVVVAIALVTGDASSATSLGSVLPSYLLQNRFSRDFEREADAHAVDALRKAGIEPRHLATMLDRLAHAHGDGDSVVPEYLRSHPPTPERIKTIDGKR